MRLVVTKGITEVPNPQCFHFAACTLHLRATTKINEFEGFYTSAVYPYAVQRESLVGMLK